MFHKILLLLLGIFIAIDIAVANPTEPLSQPPGKLKADQAPVFVVLGFDDNTTSSGINWALSLFANKRNPKNAKKNNPATFDGTPLTASFYMNTWGLTAWHSDNPENLRYSVKMAHEMGHEIANHTDNHHADLAENDFKRFTQKIRSINKQDWHNRIQQCDNTLSNQLNLDKENITGFRAPYLLYNKNMFDELEKLGFTYDTSIEEGVDERFDGTNFRWPYTLHKGAPGHRESWNYNKENPDRFDIGSYPNLWEIPSYVLIIPSNKLANKYQFKKGLRKRIKKRLPHIENNKITSFDYNLWVNAKLTKPDVLAILKYNLDLRIEGNHAPFTFGIHSQYYTNPAWQKKYAPQVSLEEMQETVEEFIDYALKKPAVRIRSANDLLSWCKNPTAI